MCCPAAVQLTRILHKGQHSYWLCTEHELSGFDVGQRKMKLRNGSEEENCMLEQKMSLTEAKPWKRTEGMECSDWERMLEAGSRGRRRVPETVDTKGKEIMSMNSHLLGAVRNRRTRGSKFSVLINFPCRE